jgi:hypothetical protein
MTNETPRPLRFAAKARRGEYWVVETAQGFAVGLIRKGRILIDGCERFADDVDALCLAMDRAKS